MTVCWTKEGRGLELRRAVNESIRENRVLFEKIGDNRWSANVSIKTQKSFSNKNEFGWTSAEIGFEVEFTPNKLDYNGVHVFNIGEPWRVDWKTYRWAVRKLSEYQIMQKLTYDQ